MNECIELGTMICALFFCDGRGEMMDAGLMEGVAFVLGAWLLRNENRSQYAKAFENLWGAPSTYRKCLVVASRPEAENSTFNHKSIGS